MQQRNGQCAMLLDLHYGGYIEQKKVEVEGLGGVHTYAQINFLLDSEMHHIL